MIPFENKRMEQFGVRRNTVREALRILETVESIKVKQGLRRVCPWRWRVEYLEFKS